MSRFEELKRAGWTPIGYSRIDELHGDYPTPENQEAALAQLFKDRGLDITKPHQKTYDMDYNAWFFKEDDRGNLITLAALTIYTG
jgi:hypothetical protein